MGTTRTGRGVVWRRRGSPKPGAWSRQRMSLATIRDGKIDYGTKDGKTDYSADHPVAGLYGAIDTALATVNVC